MLIKVKYSFDEQLVIMEKLLRIKLEQNPYVKKKLLETKDYTNTNFDVGHIVKDYFPNLSNKWKLFIGNTTSAFIEEIGHDIDFVMIDTSHVMPGEALSLIEILPFLKTNAIITLDDLHFQQRKKKL